MVPGSTPGGRPGNEATAGLLARDNAQATAAGPSHTNTPADEAADRSPRREYDRAVERPTVRVARLEELESALHDLGLGDARPTLVLVGGAQGIDEDEAARLKPFFAELARTADNLGAAVVDGGTDAGVIRLLGRARAESGGSFPLVGVVAGALVAPPGAAAGGEGAPLEPHHSCFVLVPGRRWGDEVVWIARVAELLAGDRPSLTLLVNGGDVSFDDVTESVKAGRPVLVVGGTGRAADALAAALRNGTPNEQIRALASSGLVHATELDEDSLAVVQEVERILSSGV